MIFAGDAAHLVSPFGARGFNSGVQDTDNLAWKLAAVLDGQAPPALLATYGIEREAAADENLLNSTRSTDFITPKSARVAHHPRRRAVACGRDAVRAHAGQLRPPVDARDLRHAALHAGHRAVRRHGPASARRCRTRPCARADGSAAWLLDLLGPRFTLLYCGAELPCAAARHHAAAPHRPRRSPTPTGLFQQRYDARPGSAWLVRPDQHLAARFRAINAAALAGVTRRALGWELRQ